MNESNAKHDRPVIGLVGGIGSGKSLVAEMLAELGCEVIDADKIGHEVLGEGEVIDRLVERFGPGILDESGAISRSALGKLAFASPEALAALNATVHPRMRGRMAERIAAAVDAGECVVLDAALLLDTDWHKLCDVIVFVDAPEDQRLTRVRTHRGWSADELARRENFQKSLDFKKTMSDHILCNNSSVSHLRRQVRLLFQRIAGLFDK